MASELVVVKFVTVLWVMGDLLSKLQILMMMLLAVFVVVLEMLHFNRDRTISVHRCDMFRRACHVREELCLLPQFHRHKCQNGGNDGTATASASNAMEQEQ